MQTLTRTAVQHSAGQARMAVFNTNGVERVQVVATLDTRTSLLCMSMDGRIYPIDEAPVPPYHLNCRTTLVSVPDEGFEWLSEGRQRIAKGKGGKSKLVDGQMTYFEWLLEQPAAVQDMAIGPRRARLLREGGLTAKRFGELNLNSRFEPRTLKEMRAMEPVAFERAGLAPKANTTVVVERQIASPNNDGDLVIEVGNEKTRLKELNTRIDDTKINGLVISENSSNWTGNSTIISYEEATKLGINGRKEWSCDIVLIEGATDSTMIHELLHSRSITHIGKEIGTPFLETEEGAVELYTRVVCKELGIPLGNRRAYQHHVTKLLEIYSETKIYDSRLFFSRDYFHIAATDRSKWLEDLVNRSIREDKINKERIVNIKLYVEAIKAMEKP